MAIDATVGGSSSNSYVTLSEADKYFQTRINSRSWENFSDQEALLIHASRLLDQYVSWYGVRAGDETVQAMDWPRIGIPDIPNNVIPSKLKQAVFELAIYLADNGVSFSTAEASKIKVGPITVDINTDSSDYLLPDNVSRIINQYGSAKVPSNDAIMQVQLVR